MNAISRTLAIFIVTFKRLKTHFGLTLAILIGLTIAVSLITTVPLYADAVSYRLLTEQLSAQSETIRRPPFTFMFHYLGSWKGPIDWAQAEALDAYFSESAVSDIGLPLETWVRHIETNNFRLYPQSAEDYRTDESWLGFFYLAAPRDFADHVTIAEGRYPSVAGQDGPVEVLASDMTADELGLQVGDRFVLYDYRPSSIDKRELEIEISGIWQPMDTNDGYWFFEQRSFDDLLIVPQETITGRIASQFEQSIFYAMWYLVLDGSDLRAGDVPALTDRIRQVERNVELLLPFTTSAISPLDALQGYHASVDRLTRLLAAYDTPVVLLVFAFIVLVVGISVDQRKSEIAMMRSRGATPGQVIGMAFLEGLFLGMVSWAAGTGFGFLFTQMMGRAQRFLDFSADSFERVILTPDSITAGILAVTLALAAQVLPAVAASKSTIISFKQEQARSVTKPWWQRTGLDLLLLIPVGYGYFMLDRQGALILIGENTSSGDLFQNPLLLLLPALTILAISLLLLRLLPLFMEGLRWLLFRTNSVGSLMAVQQLARAPRLYTTPIVLLSLTVGLAIFTASLAQTLDYQVYDAQLFRVGADLSLKGPGIPILSGGSRFNPNPDNDRQMQAAIFLPLSEYETFPGVASATRVGKYGGTVFTGGNRIPGTIYGIDRGDFAEVAFWRRDFARFRLGSLLNALALSPEALLVSTDFLRNQGLRIDDFLRVDVSLGEGSVQLNGQIVGAVDYFPSWYPEGQGPLLVTNLEYLFTLAGGEFPYDVWLKTDAVFDETGFKDWLWDRRLFTWRWEAPYEAIRSEQMRPERQGLFGLLSVGFIASAVVTLLGYFIYALFSFKKRMIEMGILRAVGMSQRQQQTWIGMEISVLIMLGLLLGVSSGVWVSRTFIPYLQIGGEVSDLVPPYLVEIAWQALVQITSLFAALFLLTMGALAIRLRRMRIFEAIKLGETT